METTAEAAAPPAASELRPAGAGLLRALRALRVAAVYALALVGIVSGYLVFWLVLLLDRRDPMARAARLQRLTGWLFRVLFGGARLARVLRFDPDTLRAARPRGPCVVVANHPTFMDIIAITAALDGACTVAKPVVYRNRLLHPLIAGMAHIEGSGSDRFALGRLVSQAVERLEQGMSLIIFPEGTRSPSEGRLPFGRTAFEIACRARVPVFSVGVRCEPVWLTKEIGPLDLPRPTPLLTLEPLATDDPADLDFDSRALKRRVEARYERWPLAVQSAVGTAVQGTAAARNVP